ncbi:HAD family hydrolase [Bermanella sp. WJH001]|uniref:HAD family hydrolase n=1 Tax=Bermanella sp. WJH001 TaxID=3048005 RepID=UPI0024BED733|nr:HAD hydrolase-like protein [Bermanella sp. WJH001]MDJ1539608.1 HAD hydrolase-like protein [Bermanella sp. WJH001]
MTKRINIFDFDGTIAESNLLKTEAFKQCAIEFGDEVADWFVRYHQENGGVTRQVKIEALCQKINNMNLYNDLMNKYERYLSDEWLNCPLLPGFRGYIETLPGVHLILSGGSKSEIEHYLEENHLKQYFKEVYGNPIDKSTNLEVIQNKYLQNDVEVFFYGDSKLDFQLSSKVCANFVFVSGVSEWKPSLIESHQFSMCVEDFIGLI